MNNPARLLSAIEIAVHGRELVRFLFEGVLRTIAQLENNKATDLRG